MLISITFRTDNCRYPVNMRGSLSHRSLPQFAGQARTPDFDGQTAAFITLEVYPLLSTIKSFVFYYILVLKRRRPFFFNLPDGIWRPAW